MSPTLADNSTKRPLYERVREELRQRCLEQGASGALPTLRQLSEDMGVNHLTISRALRDLEGDGLVQIVPRRGIFIVPPARTAVEVITLAAGVRHIAETPMRVFNGMQSAIGNRGRVSGSTIAAPDAAEVPRLVQSMVARGVNAVAVLGFCFAEPAGVLQEAMFIQELAQRLPVVLVGSQHEFLPLEAVSCDPRSRLREYLEQKYAAGFRRFAYVGAEIQRVHFRERFDCFRQFFLDHGLVWNEAYVPQPTESGRTVAAELLDVTPMPEVIVAATLSRAYNLVLEAQSRGLKPGEDIHIVCVASSREQSRSILPYATVIFLDEEELGRQVLRRIEHLLVERQAETPPASGPELIRVEASFLKEDREFAAAASFFN